MSVCQQWFNLYCPTRTNDSHTDAVLSAIDSSALQLDVAKVFKGRVEKKSVQLSPLINTGTYTAGMVNFGSTF